MTHLRRFHLFVAYWWLRTFTPNGKRLQAMRKESKNELFVMGEGEVEITLEFHPDDVMVQFDEKKSHHMVPCVPDCEDLLEWRIHRKYQHHRHHHVLIIKWDVSSPRTVVWQVSAKF